MHKDFSDLLSVLNAHSVRHLIIGGYAYARYTEPRATKDLDIFLSADPANASAVYAALKAFGANLAEVSATDFADPANVFQIGAAPIRVDLLCRIDGVSFEEAWETSEPAVLDDGTPVRYISAEKLMANKIAAGRPQDLVDAERLRETIEARSSPE